MASNSASAEGGPHSGGRLIVHAPNVHTGGGAVLLNAILSDRAKADELVLTCDRRMNLTPGIEAAIAVHRVEPSIPARLAAEKHLRDLAQRDDVVLAFGNLPPLYRLRARTVLFLQNRYLIDPAMSLGGFGLVARSRLALERLWLRSRIGNADRVIVQTASMAELVRRTFGRRAEVAPFAPAPARAPKAQARPGRQFDFIYVSSGEPHKNHARLIEAWGLLAASGATPTLALTLSAARNPLLLRQMEENNAERATRIVNLDILAASEIPAAYESAGALIFPSLGESFGLPLIEAAGLGLPILASELDYVRDVVRPAETFDPRSARSIARAVRRFMNLPEALDAPVSAGAFLEQVRKEQS